MNNFIVLATLISVASWLLLLMTWETLRARKVQRLLRTCRGDIKDIQRLHQALPEEDDRRR